MRSLLGAAIEEEADVTLVDMEAGLEHLSRSGGTLAYADVLLMIMEPSRKSILTAGRTIALAHELGIPLVYGVGNKARMPEDAEFFEKVAAEYNVPLAGIIPHDPDVIESDRSGENMTPEQGLPVRQAIDAIVAFVDKAIAGENPGQAEREALLRERERVDKRLAELNAE
ncbi:MAG TPA: hypothetical protein VHM89_16155 [Acidimicrobiales bacterium]|nr:hypothetical protein [Acidimicrobiales bacterium]